MAFNVIFGCVMALLVLLYSISSAARYYIKFTLFITISLVVTLVCAPFMLLRPRDPRNALMPAKLLLIGAKYVLGIRWKVRGLENVDDSRGAVILLNHQSGLDLIVLAIIWPLLSRCTVVSKKALLFLFPFGPITWLWGTVFIDRASAASARSTVNQQADAVRDRKAKLLLFPEGTRHMGDTLLPFRKGAFHAALAAEAPLQPIVTSRYHHIDSKRKRFSSGEIIVTILPLIETKGLTKDDIPALVERTQASMQDVFTKASAETQPKSKST